MTVLVSGGASSGKSAWAEEVAFSLAAGREGRLLYLASLDRNAGGDTAERIARHRAARAGKGFETLELAVSSGEISVVREDGSPGVPLLRDATVLFEDVGNLVARALFSDGGGVRAALRFLERMEAVCGHLVAVTNDIFLGGADCLGGTLRPYCDALSRANAALARTAEKAYCVVAGIPLEL